MGSGLSAAEQHRLDEVRRMIEDRDFSAWVIEPNEDGTIEIRIDIPLPNGFYDGCDVQVRAGMFSKKRFACWHCPAFGDARDDFSAKAKLRCREVMYHARTRGPI